MKWIYLFLPVVFLFCSLAVAGEGLEKEREKLLERDRAFARMVPKEGLVTAFNKFAAPGCRVLPLAGHPFPARDIAGVLGENPRVKTWEPLAARVAASADLGCTYGKVKEEKAYYITLWRKGEAGGWQVVCSQGLVALPGGTGTGKPRESFTEGTGAMVEADRAFSSLSVIKGTPRAFFEYIAEDGLALGMGGEPVTWEKFRELAAPVKGNEPKKLKRPILEWQPLAADISKARDLGYTLGWYVSTRPDREGKMKKGYGYYLSVWQKQPDGAWKFILDGGNTVPPAAKSK